VKFKPNKAKDVPNFKFGLVFVKVTAERIYELNFVNLLQNLNGKN